LVAIDVNSGRATKEGSIEQTATKTNLEAADEVARQLRLRDLAGLIVIDFIDMDERKNNAAVEKRFKDKLKTDRARIQVGRISGFGLMEMSRQRLRPGMIEATTQPCPHCHGTGLLRSDDNLALSILRQIEEEGVRGRSKEVLVKAPTAIANYLMNQKRDHVLGIEARYGLSVRVEADPFMISPDFAIEKFKTASRVIAEPAANVISSDTAVMADVIEDDPAEETAQQARADTPENGEGEGQPKKRRRRRRRRRGGGNGDGNGEAVSGENGSDAAPQEAEAKTDAAPVEVDAAPAGEVDTAEAPKPKRTRTRRKPKEEVAPEPAAEPAPEPVAAEAEPAEKPVKKRATRSRKTAEPKAEATTDVEATTEPATEAAPKAPRKRASRAKAKPVAAQAVEGAEVAAPEAAKAELATAEPAKAEPARQAAEPDDGKPKRKGWWSLGR
ncbi:MAG: ribonuclease E/G, partial [Thalassobium sp.]